MTATTDRCPGCHGSGIEMSGVTYAGMSEYVGCHECSPECPDDCGCRVDAEPERPESIAPRHPGATQSPDGSQGATEGPRGAEGATGHGISAVPHLETAPLPSASDVRPVPPARDAELVEFEAVSAARYEAGLSAEGRAARHAALAWGAEFRTKPNPDQPDRCPSIDPHDTLQCTRRIHEDGQCQSGGIAWVKGTPRYMSDAERANRMEGMAERLAALLVDVEERLTGERDRAIGFATRVEAENARMVEWNAITTRAFETTRRVLQEASGLPDDIDDPDCRDEMVLALRPRAEKAEAEVARLRAEAEVERLRAGIEERVVGWSSYRTDPASLTAASCAESLRRLLTPPDAQEPAQEPRTGAGGPGVPDQGCEAVSGAQDGSER